jgi:hypothetical protein
LYLVGFDGNVFLTFLGIRATFSEEPNQYVKEDRNGAVAVEESPVLTEIETEEATAAEVSDEFFFNLVRKAKFVCFVFLINLTSPFSSI